MVARNSELLRAWNNYWFRPWPALDLAMLRLSAVGMQCWLLIFDPRYGRQALRKLDGMPEGYYEPLPALKLILLPFDGAELSLSTLESIHMLACVTGVLALVGLFTNLSLCLFAGCSLILQLWMVSHSDVHHPEAVMMIALAVLALGPSGGRLPVDSLIAGLLRPRRYRAQLLDDERPMARWPILIVQWIFVLMYVSAAYAKIRIGGWDWPNGFTLQYYLAGQGLLNDAPLGVWMSQFHGFVLISQWGVLLFQMTFIFTMFFQKLKWIYVPAGMFMHFAIYLLLAAPFFQWIALYGAFIPWTGLGRWLRSRIGGGAYDAQPSPKMTSAVAQS